MSTLPSNAKLTRANELLYAGRFHQTDALCRQVLADDRRNVTALALLGQSAMMQGRPEEAVRILREGLGVAPKSVELCVLLAEANTTRARHREALTAYEKALKLRPDFPAALAGKANVLMRQGRWKRARSLLEPIVKRGAEDASIACMFAAIERHDGRHQEAIDVARRHADEDIRAEFRRRLWAEIGEAYQAMQEYDAAFEAFATGNALGDAKWDADGASRRCREIIDRCSRDALDAIPCAHQDADSPVFIVGMVRSGSTLVEQIIDAHPDAFGAGELLTLYQLAEGLGVQAESNKSFPAYLTDLTQGDVDEASRSYVDEIERLAPKAKRITDKYLSNYDYLGLISRLFPKARVIHTMRHPLDTCTSAFVHRFGPGQTAFTDDLVTLGRMYNDYHRLMRHWREVLDLPMLEVQYEALVADTEGISRQIIDFCGLDWDERCLRFYATGREVTTLSRDQVSQPVYGRAVKRWQRYQRHLGPLIDVLDDEVRSDMEKLDRQTAATPKST